MPNELKIVIDADAQPATTEIKNFGKVFNGEFNKINTAASGLQKSIQSSIDKINSSLAGLKITSLDVKINTSSIDASIKNIQSKFSSLVDPELNVFANTAQAEAKIKDLLAELSTLKGSEIFIRANDTQALRTINEVEAELKSLVGRQIDLSVRADLSKLEELRTKLSSLKVTPIDVSVNTSGIDATIKNIQAKFESLVDPQISVLADTAQAEIKIKELLSELSTLKGSEIFIKANDTQALKKINEIEAELNSLVGKQINLSVTADLTKLEDLKAKLASLKVTPINVTANLSSLDASIKTIQGKFAALIDPEINVLANTELAEAKIKELIGELSALKGSEIFIRANDAQALKTINEVEAELNNILDKQIKINVNATGITDTAQKIKALEAQLINLEALKVSPDVSTTQLQLFEANIKRIKAEIASLKTQGLVVPIGVDTVQAQRNVNLLSETIETLRAKAEAKKSFIQVETDITKIAAYNKEIEKLEARMRSIQNVGKKGFELFVVPNQTINSVKSLTASVAAFGGGVKTHVPPAIAGFKKVAPSIAPIVPQLKAATASTNAFAKAFGGLRSLAAIIPGIGLGGLIGIAATAVNQLTEGFFEAAFGASKLDQAIDAAAGSIDKNAASVVLMVRALQSGTLSSSEFKKVKAELIAQAPEFQKSFDGDKIKIEASEAALQNYIKQLTTTVRVTAALTLVNDVLAKSLAVIAKGGETTALEKVTTAFGKFNPVAKQLDIKPVDLKLKSLNKALETFQPENITKLIDDTFKKLGITFNDFAKTVDGKALEDALAKQKAAFAKVQAEVIAKAQQFKKQFGDTFVLPELEVSFFVNKDQVFKNALKVLSDAKFDLSRNAALEKLIIKLPVFVTTETKLDDSDLKKFLRGEITRDQVKEIKVTVPVITDFDIQTGISLEKEFDAFRDSLINNFITGEKLKIDIPIEVTPDLTLAKGNLDLIDKKLDLQKQFEILGDLGTRAFNKIDFTNINEGLAEATKKLQGMMEVALTLNQAIGEGLVNAFNAAFDAVLEGKNVFKALGQAIKQLVVETIKAIVKMLILKAITKFLLPGLPTGGVGQVFGSGFAGGGFGSTANFGGAFGGIGSSAFNNTIEIVGRTEVSGQNLVLVFNRANSSSGRFG